MREEYYHHNEEVVPHYFVVHRYHSCQVEVYHSLAREAASSDEGLIISPLVNTDRKGGAYRIML
jgi:hypothetical protein